ncbi:MAG TPA: sugar phosphate nucleotidyltransferase [Desulfurivibrionaceae bacterium]|nr:sugar phosphate nucleotidyltransferase [Desulfurivibrionaceae bacterium]
MATMPKKAMILAAGLGTRLRPYTLSRPKPLFPVLDTPLAMAILRQVQAAGFGPVVINAYHLAEQVVAAFRKEPGVILQVETKEMGTGGGLRLALPNFDATPVLIVNGDVVHNLDLAWVYEEHLRSGNDVTMVMHDHPRFNTVRVAADGRILGFVAAGATAGSGERLLAFTGIHVVDPAVLAPIPGGIFHNIIDRYRDVIAAGGRIGALIVQNHFWTDMGTPADYLALHGQLLTGLAAPSLPVAPAAAPLFQGHGVRLGTNVRLDDWVAIGSHAMIGDNVHLSRVVVWDGATVPAGTVAVDTILI